MTTKPAINILKFYFFVYALSFCCWCAFPPNNVSAGEVTSALSVLKARETRATYDTSNTTSTTSIIRCAVECLRESWCGAFNTFDCNQESDCQNCELLGGEEIQLNQHYDFNYYVVQMSPICSTTEYSNSPLDIPTTAAPENAVNNENADTASNAGTTDGAKHTSVTPIQGTTDFATTAQAAGTTATLTTTQTTIPSLATNAITPAG